MKKSKLWLKILIPSVITIILCALAAMYTPPGFSHTIGMITNDGGKARHAAMLGLNNSSYVVLVTGTVKAPYHGDVRVVMEGEPAMNYDIESTYPPEIDLGYRGFHDYKDQTLLNLKPWQKFSLMVKLDPDFPVDHPLDYQLKFYDVKSGESVLTVPLEFREYKNFHISKEVRRPSHDNKKEKNRHAN